METLSLIVVSLFFVAMIFILLMKTVNRIPNRGRSNYANGEKILATITNENRVADKPATMKLVDKNGNKYRVKMKPDEAKMWIKGDTVEILLSDKKGVYRVLFTDYFRQNESRMRENVAEKLSATVKPWLFAARFTGYTEKSSEALKNSEADSRILFMFMNYMKIINVYTIVAFVGTVLFLSWRGVYAPSLSRQTVPFIVLLMIYYVIYSAVTTCKKLLKKYAQ